MLNIYKDFVSMIKTDTYTKYSNNITLILRKLIENIFKLIDGEIRFYIITLNISSFIKSTRTFYSYIDNI